MAGVKGRSGGARPGAGRPKKVRPPDDAVGAALEGTAIGSAAESPSVATPKNPIPAQDTPLAFLKAVMNDTRQPLSLRMRAALSAAQYEHTRRKDGGKKEEQQQKADKVAASRFAPRAAPKLKRVA